MTILSTEQKIEAYSRCLKYAKNPKKDRSIFVCVNLNLWLLNNIPEFTAKMDELKYFPEFLVKRPEFRETKMTWWDVNEKHLRVQALEEILTDLKNK